MTAVEREQLAASRGPRFGDPWSRGDLQPPRVAVIITCHNYARFVEAALDSVAAQTYPNIECVVVDDASRDGTSDVIRRWLDRAADARFRLITNTTNCGQLASFAKGLAVTESEFVAFLDADDLWLPQFVRRHLEVHLNAVAVFPVSCSDLLQIDEGGRVLAGNTFWARHLGNGARRRRSTLEAAEIPRLDHPDEAWPLPGATGRLRIVQPDLFRWHWTVTSGMMFRRAMIELLMPVEPDRVRLAADMYLVTLAHYFSGSLLLDETLGAYRRHGGNLFSKLPVTGSRAALAPQNGLPLTRRNFRVMLDHVRANYDTFATIFGAGAAAKFCLEARLFLIATAISAGIARVFGSRNDTVAGPS
jgi:glycosyltransferase involved in cell wall biosynthesis